MSKLSEWSDIIKESYDIEHKKEKEWNDNLPTPDAILEIEGIIYGYWKFNENEIIRYRKYSNGYNSHSATYFTKEEIETINKIWSKSLA